MWARITRPGLILEGGWRLASGSFGKLEFQQSDVPDLRITDRMEVRGPFKEVPRNPSEQVCGNRLE